MTQDVIARGGGSFDDVGMTETTTATTTDAANTDTDHQAVIDGYFACWNATDDADRLAAVERTWAVDATSSDPLAAVTGHAELAEMFAAFHVTYAGSSFRQKGGVDAHHDLVRWGWEMVGPDDTVHPDRPHRARRLGQPVARDPGGCDGARHRRQCRCRPARARRGRAASGRGDGGHRPARIAVSRGPEADRFGSGWTSMPVAERH